MLKGFISYAHEDGADICMHLRRQLAKLDANGIARFWTDRQLRVGDQWEDRVLIELENADIAIFVVTPRAVDPTSYVRRVELPLAAFNASFKGLVVIPALAVRTQWQLSPLSERQSCPSPPWIDFSSSDKPTIEWAFRVATDIESLLTQSRGSGGENEIGNKRQAILEAVQEFESYLASLNDEIGIHAKIGALKFAEAVRYVARSPLSDISLDAALVLQVSDRFLRASEQHEGLFACMKDIDEALKTLHRAVPTRPLESRSVLIPKSEFPQIFSELDHSAKALSNEVQYLLQNRRMTPDTGEDDSMIEAIASLADRKVAIAETFLDEPEVDVRAVAQTAESLDSSAKGFRFAIGQKNVSNNQVNEFVSSVEEFNFRAEAAVNLEKQFDLKRIRGVGVLIEKRLNAMGYNNTSQIAAWTPEDAEKISRALDLRGRIQRENWIEQARVLAAGGQTEFSRRISEGDGG